MFEYEEPAYYITRKTLLSILNNRSARRLLCAMLENVTNKSIVYDVTVTKYTKLLRYKNKSTVSRALATLKKLNLIRPGLFKNNYYINTVQMPDPL